MNIVPKSSEESLRRIQDGEVLTCEDGNQYIVHDKSGIMYLKSIPTEPKNIPKLVNVQEHIQKISRWFNWTDNQKKPNYIGDMRDEMTKNLCPKISPTIFYAGYVWTTKFNNISYVVDIEYKGSSTTSSRVWVAVHSRPPCLDAENYPFKYICEEYHVVYDEKGNKFWSLNYGSDNNIPMQHPSKYPEGHRYVTPDGYTWISKRNKKGNDNYYGYSWEFVESDDE